MKGEWKELEHNTWVYFNPANGQILGKITTTYRKDTFMTLANGTYMGEYISLETAKNAVENPDTQPKPKQGYYNPEVRP